jgi:hypothetical protein
MFADTTTDFTLNSPNLRMSLADTTAMLLPGLLDGLGLRHMPSLLGALSTVVAVLSLEVLSSCCISRPDCHIPRLGRLSLQHLVRS